MVHEEEEKKKTHYLIKMCSIRWKRVLWWNLVRHVKAAQCIFSNCCSEESVIGSRHAQARWCPGLIGVTGIDRGEKESEKRHSFHQILFPELLSTDGGSIIEICAGDFFLDVFLLSHMGDQWIFLAEWYYNMDELSLVLPTVSNYKPSS